MQSSIYWSSSSVVSAPYLVWVVYLNDGVVAGDSKTYSDGYVWPVRGGQ